MFMFKALWKLHGAAWVSERFFGPCPCKPVCQWHLSSPFLPVHITRPLRASQVPCFTGCCCLFLQKKQKSRMTLCPQHSGFCMQPGRRLPGQRPPLSSHFPSWGELLSCSNLNSPTEVESSSLAGPWSWFLLLDMHYKSRIQLSLKESNAI